MNERNGTGTGMGREGRAKGNLLIVVIAFKLLNVVHIKLSESSSLLYQSVDFIRSEWDEIGMEWDAGWGYTLLYSTLLWSLDN